MRIGQRRHNVNVASEFDLLSAEDEAAAETLAGNGHYRQACYFLIQAMEKAVRAKIFTLVNPNIDYFRERNRSHSLDAAIEFLVEIISTDSNTREHVSQQLHNYVLGETQYGHLHNDLRYPFYSTKFDSYSALDVGVDDFRELRIRLRSLRTFLCDIHRFTSII